tara:strand:+ start:208 stop:666 length:459 start_codon:yes stop_codon:yes gene_type:complete
MVDEMITQEDIDAFKESAPSRVPRTSSILEMVRDFAKRMDQPLDNVWPTSLKLEDLRWAMIQEEYTEAFDESCNRSNEEAMLKELADLVYVTFGYAATYGWNLDEAVRRVHLSNMSKLGLDGKPLKNPEGKVLKGPNYQKCNLSDLVGTNNE